jgi:hypothetical protein
VVLGRWDIWRRRRSQKLTIKKATKFPSCESFGSSSVASSGAVPGPVGLHALAWLIIEKPGGYLDFEMRGDEWCP